MNNIDFYKQCSIITGIKTELIIYPPKLKRFNKEGNEIFRQQFRPTRWNNRKPGNGRFPRLGIIRAFSPTHIQINIRKPYLCGQYKSYESALKALNEVFKNNLPSRA